MLQDRLDDGSLRLYPFMWHHTRILSCSQLLIIVSLHGEQRQQTANNDMFTCMAPLCKRCYETDLMVPLEPWFETFTY